MFDRPATLSTSASIFWIIYIVMKLNRCVGVGLIFCGSINFRLNEVVVIDFMFEVIVDTDSR